jgi:hypothetical protein
MLFLFPLIVLFGQVNHTIKELKAIRFLPVLPIRFTNVMHYDSQISLSRSAKNA